MKQIVFLAAFLMTITYSEYSIGQGTSTKPYRYSVGPSGTKISSGKKISRATAWAVNSNQLNGFVLSHKIQSEVDAGMVHIQAVRDFTRSFKHMQNPTWYKTEAGFIATFQWNGIFRKIAYDDKGRWLYNLLEYVEAELDSETRNMVKRKYYDYDIQIIHQYEFTDDKTVYMIRMQDRQSNIVTLKVCNEEMELLTHRD